jgi:hypothetical protein
VTDAQVAVLLLIMVLTILAFIGGWKLGGP